MIAAYRWESNWKILVLVLIIVPVLLRLGFWQLQRADEKIQLQAIFDQQQSLPAVPFEQLLTGAAQLTEASRTLEDERDIEKEKELSARRVLLKGKFDSQKTFLLDNQIVHGRPGYDVISPFTTETGRVVLVNRGWVMGFADRAQLPSIALVSGTVELEASVHIPLGKAVVLAEDIWSTDWPVVVQWVNIPRIGDQLEQDIYPYVLRIEEGQLGGLQRHWLAINTQPEKHLGYAVQWFLMALALTVFWLYSSIKPT